MLRTGATPVLLLLLAVAAVSSASAGVTRKYYIQAQEVLWHYGDDYINNCTGASYTGGAELYMQIGSGVHYWKALYVAYTDGTFTTEQPRPAEEEHLGALGPLIRAEVGDTIEVVFRNALDFDVNLVPTGVKIQSNDTTPVPPNTTTVYTWPVTSRAGPGPSDASSVIWMYGSNVDLVAHQSAGLIGPMIIVREGNATADAKPVDADIEFVVMFYLMQENLSPLFNKTLETYNLTDPLLQTNLTETSWIESHNMHAINGMMYCWLPGLVIPSNATSARWHAVDQGAEQDIHNSHWHGMTLFSKGRYVDQFSLFAGQSFTGDMVLDNPGTWWFHCHINDHLHGGMMALYTLEGTAVQHQDQGDIQQYYIAAEEALWDYAPQKSDMCSGSSQPLDNSTSIFVQPDNFTMQMGSQVLKALFYEYTDATFTTRKAADPALGYLGPTLRAKVGDTIKVTFKNKCSFTTSLHPHGVLYAKDSEGSPYNDGTSGENKLDDHVHTGQIWNYTWYVTNRTAPGDSEGSSVVWMYHSHAHETQDTLAGLMGAIIITRRDMAKADNSPQDVDKEFVLAFNINDETSSFLVRDNLARSFPSLPSLQYYKLLVLASFQSPHNYHAINGYLFCNGPSLNATVGERVRFYILTLGTEADLHNPNLITSQWTSLGHRSEALQSIAGDMQTADVIPTVSGDWLLQCRASEHFASGMKAIFHVDDAPEEATVFNGTERTSFIMATEIQWDYVPSGQDLCDNRDFTSDEASQWGDGTMGHNYMKAVYRGFTDDTFEKMAAQDNPTDGLLGPSLHAEVGDLVTVVFKNNLSQPVNLQLGGGLTPLHNDSLVDAPIPPGAVVTYSWLVPEGSGPGLQDMSTIAYVYTSSVDVVGDLNAGLMGPLIIGRAGALNASGLPYGVDREIAMAYVKVNEQDSWLFQDNLQFTNFTVPDYLTDYDDYSAWQGTVTYYTINGWIFCNQPDLQLKQGELVRLVLIGLGGELDLHSPVFTNQVLVAQGSRTLSRELSPSMSAMADFIAASPGRWQYTCLVQEHFTGGMRGMMQIEGQTQDQ